MEKQRKRGGKKNREGGARHCRQKEGSETHDGISRMRGPRQPVRGRGCLGGLQGGEASGKNLPQKSLTAK